MSSCTPMKEKMSMNRSIYQYANIVPRPEVTWSVSATFLKTTDDYSVESSVASNLSE